MSQLSEIQKHLLGAAVFLAAMAVLPIFVGQRYILGEIIVFMLWASVAVQWNVLMGHAGVFSLGQMLFFAIGAYTVGMGGAYLDMPLWQSIPTGALAAAVAALLIGLACIRLAPAYVALLTFAIVFMVYSLITTESGCYSSIGGSCRPLFGGNTGFSGFDDFGFRPLLKGNWVVGNYFVVLVGLGISFIASIIVIHGRLGLAFRAIRDNATYAASRGINRTRFHVVVFAITSFFTGMTGGIYAGHYAFAGPSLFELPTLVLILAMIIVGGLRSTWGPILGALLIMTMVFFARGTANIQNTAVGITLVLFVLLLPRGLAGAGIYVRSLLQHRKRAGAKSSSII